MAPMRVPSGLLGPAMPADRWRAAGTAALVGLVAGVLRFRGLGQPAEFVFDETYYAKDAWALLRTGAERAWAEGANDQILAGDLSGLGSDPAFASHPPLGKWVIAMGQAVDGLTPLGWRLGVAALGTLAAVVMVYLARRVTRSTLLGGLAGLLVALDGLAITTSRVAVLDGMLMFWLVLATAFLVRDRDAAREQMAAAIRGTPPADAESGPRAPIPLWRPWRLLMGVALGLACATKWSGAPVLAAFGLLSVAWQAGALAQAGARHPVRRSLLVDAPVGAVTVVGSAAVSYLLTWWGWLAGSDGYERQWGAQNPPSSAPAALLPDALRSLWHYHAVAYQLLTELDSDHNWQSAPIGWLVLVRPVLMYRDKPTQGVDGCTAETCVADILAVGTPLTWWLGVAAVLFLLWRAIARRDWRAWLVVGGVAATWLPWFAYSDRPVFSFYAVATLPFLVLAVVVTLRVLPDAWASPGPAIARRGRPWVLLGAALLLLATVVQAWFFWPVWVGTPIPLEDWQLRMWLPRWS
jgi:dolichyl-phosphate-mannose-protein mannosyltransferase